MRSRRIADLKPDIEQGHLSTSICHMANISLLTGEPMTFTKARDTLPVGNAYAANALESMVEHLRANAVDVDKSLVTVGPMLNMDSKRECFVGAHSERANWFIRDSYRTPFL